MAARVFHLKFTLSFLVVWSLLSGCEGAAVSDNFQPGIILSQNPSPTPAASVPFTQSWGFSVVNSGVEYLRSNLISLGILDRGGGQEVVRLNAADQIDDDVTALGFGGSTSSAGVCFDGSLLRFSQVGDSVAACNRATVTNAELSSEWTPHWNELIAYWKMNNNWSDAVGSHVGTALDQAGFTSAAKVGSHAGVFDGSGDYVDVADAPELTLGTKFTAQVWVYPTSFASLSMILGKWAQDANDEFAVFLNTDGRLLIGWHTTGGGSYGSPSHSDFSTTGTVGLNAWSHIAVVRDGSSIQVYINGVSAGSTSSLDTLPIRDGTMSFRIGGEAQGGATNRFFTGKIDEAALWSTALSADAIRAVYRHQNAGKFGFFTSRAMDAFSSAQSWRSLAWTPTLPFLKNLPDGGVSESNVSTDYPGLSTSTLMSGNVGLWHLDEPAGSGTVADSSGHGNTGSVGSNVVLGSPGKIGSAARFNGTNSITLSAGDIPVGSSDRTVSLWFNQTTLSNAAILAYGAGAPGMLWEMMTLSGNVIFHCYGGGCDSMAVSAPYQAGEWNHLALTYANGVTRIYFNGVYRGSHSAVINTSTAFFNIGGPGYYPVFDGLIDEVGIWSRELAAAEVKELYRRGANRALYQVRTCSATSFTSVPCDDEPNWVGPDGTSGTYFSELQNTAGNAAGGSALVTPPNLTFSNFGTALTNALGADRYFQYRVIFESDDRGNACDYGSGPTACSPELKSVGIGPVHYDSSSPSVITQVGTAFSEVTSLSETLGAGGCSGGVGYNVGLSSTGPWKYWDGTAWATSSGAIGQTSTHTELASGWPSLGTAVGRGSLFLKAYLKSDGVTPCELDGLLLQGLR